MKKKKIPEMLQSVSPRPDRMNPMESPKLRIEGVSFYYGKGTPFEVKALDNVSLDIRSGVLTGIIGHTGSGKSTLVQMFNGLSKPEEGRILLDGTDIWEKPKEIGQIRYRVGLVMQYPEYQLFDETVEADIAFGPRNMGLSEQEIRERVAEAVSFVGLDEELLQKSPFDLSGGQKRRVALAGIIAMRPEVLVLDEPAAGLDPLGKEEIMSLLHKIHAQWCKTVIIVSHDMDEIAENCTNVAVFSDGKVVLNAPPSSLFKETSALEKIGLDVPFTAKLCMLLEKNGYVVHCNYTMDDFVLKITQLTNTDGAGMPVAEFTERGDE